MPRVSSPADVERSRSEHRANCCGTQAACEPHGAKHLPRLGSSRLERRAADAENRSAKAECVDRMVLLGEGHLPAAIKEFVRRPAQVLLPEAAWPLDRVVAQDGVSRVREGAAVVAPSEASRREEAQGGTMKGTATPGLSRRAFLASASALGSVAIKSSAAPDQIATLAPFEKLPP